MTFPTEPPYKPQEPTLEPALDPAPLRLPPPQHGPPPAASGEKAGKRAWWKALLALLAVMVLGIAGCTVWFVRTVGAPVGVANDFLAEVNADDFAAAEDYFGACSQGLTAADLEPFRGQELSYNLTSSSISNNQAEVTGSFMIDGVSASDIGVRLVKEGGDWKVCGFSWGDSGDQ